MSFTILIEQTVALEISKVQNSATTWTADTASIYYYDLGTRNVVDGVKRQITSVRFGATELTHVGSFAACDATDASWIIILIAGQDRLYINPPTTVNPNTVIVLARFKLYFSNFAVHYGGNFYESRVLLSPEDASVRMAIDGDSMTSQTTGNGTVRMANGDGYFDTLLTRSSGYHFLNQEIKVSQLDGATETTLTRGLIGRIERTDATAAFQIFTPLSLLDVPLLKKRFSSKTQSDYPDQEVYASLPGDIEGEYQPVIIGQHPGDDVGVAAYFPMAVPVVMVNRGTETGAGTGVYRASAFKVCATVKNPKTGTTHGIETPAVYRYSNGTVSLLLETTNYTLSESNTLITMNNAASGELLGDDVIRAAMVYYKDDASGTFTGTANNPIVIIPDVIHFLITCFTNVQNSQLDIATLAVEGVTKVGTAGTWHRPSWDNTPSLATPWYQQGYFDSQINVRDIVDAVAFPSDSLVLYDLNGLITLRRYTLNEPEEVQSLVDWYITEPDISQYVELLSSDSVVNRIAVRYGQLAAGAQNMEFNILTARKRKRKRRKKKHVENQIIQIETQAARIRRNALTRSIGGTSVVDDLGSALGIENEVTVVTYFVWNALTDASEASTIPAQAFADELYRRWGRGYWVAKLIDTDGELLRALPTDQVIIYRRRSANGDIGFGKAFYFIDGTRRYANKVTELHEANEVI